MFFKILNFGGQKLLKFNFPTIIYIFLILTFGNKYQ
jgi:hypothetical protein